VKTVALMQPYFFPYGGYWRLLARADEFVIYDDVQFRKGGRIHRTQVPDDTGVLHWLTLPLARQPLGTRIRDRAFAENARQLFDERLRRFEWIASAAGPSAARIRAYLHAPLDSPVDYLEGGLRLVADILGLRCTISRSSALDVDPSLPGQARVVALARAAGATRYLNAPGGRDLYDPAAFERQGVELAFLPTYEGPHVYMLRDLMTLSAGEIAL